MELLPKTTYEILKSLRKNDLLKETIINKYGESTETRLDDLIDKKYIRISSQKDPWGKLEEPAKYSITESGLSYLEDYKDFVNSEKWSALKNSVIVPILVSVISSLLINGISLLLQMT